MAGMKASRTAEQTSKLVGALANRAATRAMLNPDGGLISSSRGSKQLKHTTPSPDDVHEHLTPAASPLKRKRGTSKSEGSTIVPIKEESDKTWTSPRKIMVPKEAKPKRAKREPAKKIKADDGTVEIQAPKDWEEIYKTTQEMRSKILAPVDTMGCENLAEDRRPPRDKRFQTLLALMLSSQTKDTVTAVAMKNMQDNMPGGLTIESILVIGPQLLNSLISKVGFHNNKTKFIKATAEILRDQHDSDIPDTIEGLVALPGVGPKMAYLCMSAAWGRDEGIGVDVHVHRITNLWGWHKTNTPEETRASLESWLPKEKWHDINHLLVGFGQTWCPPVGRKCDECHLSKGLCPSATVGKITQQKSQRTTKVVKDEGADHAVKTEIESRIDRIPIKAEDLPPALSLDAKSPIQDIEDIGSTRRSARLAR